jgi:hypothetical protein
MAHHENAPIILNQQVKQFYAEDPEGISAVQNLLPVAMIESADITEATVYLCAVTSPVHLAGRRGPEGQVVSAGPNPHVLATHTCSKGPLK